MYDSDESVTDHICLTQKQKKEREEPNKKIYTYTTNTYLAAGEGLSGVPP
jgi:hypothetical protein